MCEGCSAELQMKQIRAAFAVVAEGVDVTDGLCGLFRVKEKGLLLQSLNDVSVKAPDPLAHDNRAFFNGLIVGKDVVIHRSASPTGDPWELGACPVP